MRISSDDDLLDAELADFPGLMAVSQFARMLRHVPFFGVIGEPLPNGKQIAVANNRSFAQVWTADGEKLGTYKKLDFPGSKPITSFNILLYFECSKK